MARWATLGLAAAAITLLWIGDHPGTEVLAATIHAMESVPVIHIVSRGDKGGHGEIWIVDGVGSWLHSYGRDTEDIMVDDLTAQYRYVIPRRPNTGIPAPRVEVVPSQMADPQQRKAIWDAFTRAGMLKELLSEKEHGKPELSWVWQGGRRLLRIHVPGLGRGTTFFSDPVTGRIQWYEDEGPDIRTNPELIRYDLDYPSLASVDRSRFRFQVPEGVEVWDETNGPARWARGAEAVCVDRLKALREALRRYANDHAGQWPEALRPALAPYVTSPDDFRCPLSVAGADAGFEYHRPGKMLTQMVLEAWNRRHADPAARLDLRLNGARPPVLECRMSPGPIFSLNADGIVYRWYPQPAAAMATAAPAGPAAIDPAAAPILKALAERDRRLSELEVTYDYRATHLVPWELPAFGPGSGKPTRQPAGDFINSHITWARKGEKMLRDERSRLPGGLERQRWITDGETVLVQRVSRPGQPLSAPSAQSSPWELRGSIADLGLSDGFGALPELPNGRWQVRALGSRITGGDQCVGLEVTDPRRPGSPDRLWFDPSHGYVLRREERYQNGKLQIEMTATQPHEWAPGIFLATRLVTIGYLGPQGQAGAPTHRWTAIVRQVTVGGLPDSLFEPVPP